MKCPKCKGTSTHEYPGYATVYVCDECGFTGNDVEFEYN